ncbi:uncharacterized protein LOC114001494 [Pipra filicauda]|uniref:Uncharacterized protein LOC114001494 n=1 Tax=Pipra filicauda TaxID=649802 RepID=A0A7R5KW26_9PASS|nr:uncharacterized protein LOC114001494 [Pipra filicauda]
MSVDGNVPPKPMDKSNFQELQGHGSTFESIFHVSIGGNIPPKPVLMDGSIFHTSMDGSIPPNSVPMDKNIPPQSMPMDGGTFHEDQGHESTHKSISLVPSGGAISLKSVPVDKSIPPESLPLDGSVFQEDQGCGFIFGSIFHVSMGESISPRSMAVGGSSSPTSMPTDQGISQEHVTVDGTISPKPVAMDETNSCTGRSISGETVPEGGTISHVSMSTDVPKDGTISPKSVPMGRTVSQENVDSTISPESMTVDGPNLPKSVPVDGTISPKSVPVDGTISPKSVPVDGTISPTFMPMGGTISPEDVPMDAAIPSMPMTMDRTIPSRFTTTDGTISPKFVPMDGTISQEHLTMDLTISAKSVTMDETHLSKTVMMDGTILPKTVPTGGTTAPEPRAPERGKEEKSEDDEVDEEEDDDDDHGSTSPEEDAEDEEDLEEEEEPQFHTNPLFQSRLVALGGAQGVPLYRTHSAAFAEGGNTTGGTGAERGDPQTPPMPTALRGHPEGDIGDIAVEWGPPQPSDRALSDPPELPLGSGRGQLEWAEQDPPAVPTPLEPSPAMISARWWPRNTWNSSSSGGRRWTRRSGRSCRPWCCRGRRRSGSGSWATSPGASTTATPGPSRPPHLRRAMTSSEFVSNLSGMNDGQDFPREQLKALYGSIRSKKLEWATEEEEEEEEAGGGKKILPQIPELPGGAVTFRRGWLARKVLAEADGKKTPWGRRGWKPFQAVLRGTFLFFLKAGGGARGVSRRPSEPGPPGAPPEEGGGAEEPLGVHHALAERAPKYTKRPNVFRLQTAERRLFLFQAPTPEEMLSWISRINLVAALFSSPPFPAAVGSQRRFVRPILPTAPSRSPPEEQLRCHEQWLERVGQELLEHQRHLPEGRGRARDLDEYRVKKEFLLEERRRYETYVQVLETWLNSGARDLEGWEAQAGGAPPDPPTLTKAHSSPSLAPEPPPGPTVRVRRNISERRTVRKIVPKRNKNLL